MPVLCVGPVCIPLNLLLPFLLGVAHHYGLLKWVKREWVTVQHWRQKFSGTAAQGTAAAGAEGAATGPSTCTTANVQPSRYVCEGGVCRMVPAEAAGDAAGPTGSSSSAVTAGSSQAASSAQPGQGARQRHSSGLQGMKAVDL